MSLACDCWIQWACEAPWDSASLMAVEQQSSASAKVLAWLASASIVQEAWWVSALLSSAMWWASTSLMVQAQRPPLPWWYEDRGLCSFYGFGDLRLIEAKGHPKIWDSFLLWVLMVDLIANRHPRALLASSWSWATSKGECHCCPLEHHRDGRGRHGYPPAWDHLLPLHLGCSLGRRCPPV